MPTNPTTVDLGTDATPAEHLIGGPGRSCHTLIIGDPSTTRDVLAARIALATAEATGADLWIAYPRTPGTAAHPALDDAAVRLATDTASIAVLLQEALALIERRTRMLGADPDEPVHPMLMVLPNGLTALTDADRALVESVARRGRKTSVAVLVAVDDGGLAQFGRNSALRAQLMGANVYLTHIAPPAANPNGTVALGRAVRVTEPRGEFDVLPAAA